eukprot:105121-Chlamydomonas_euryale.AAC.1
MELYATEYGQNNSVNRLVLQVLIVGMWICEVMEPGERGKGGKSDHQHRDAPKQNVPRSEQPPPAPHCQRKACAPMTRGHRGFASAPPLPPRGHAAPPPPLHRRTSQFLLAAWPHDRMTAWPGGRMAEWPHGWVAAWPHG